jgi:hypothetical protein
MKEKIRPVNPGIGRHQIADKTVRLPQGKFPARCRFYHSWILIESFVVIESGLSGITEFTT